MLQNLSLVFSKSMNLNSVFLKSMNLNLKVKSKMNGSNCTVHTVKHVSVSNTVG